MKNDYPSAPLGNRGVEASPEKTNRKYFDAGVDMSSPAPIMDAIESFNATLGEMEKLLGEIGALKE